MIEDAFTDALRLALDDLIAVVRAEGPGRIITTAERDAVLWVTDREEGPRDARLSFPAVPEHVRTRRQ
ncbi:hypothetical protein ACLBXJ_03865 [Methylobacterium mesophilicum]